MWHSPGSGSLQEPCENIHSHVESLLVKFRRIVGISADILPSVPQIAFIGEQDRDAPVDLDAIGGGGLSIMLMDLRKAMGKSVMALENRMTHRQRTQGPLWKQHLHFGAKGFRQAVIIIGKKQAS